MVKRWLPGPLRKRVEVFLAELRAARRVWGEMTPNESAENLVYVATAELARRRELLVAVIELLERAEDIE